MDDTFQALPPNSDPHKSNMSPSDEHGRTLGRTESHADGGGGNACGLPSSGEGTPVGLPGAEPHPPASSSSSPRSLTMDQARHLASTALRAQVNSTVTAEYVPPLAPTDRPRPSTSLDTTETTVAGPIEAFLAEKPSPRIDPATITLNITSYAAKFRHAGWWDVRKKIFASLQRTAQSSSRLSSFSECGSASWIQQNLEDPTRLRLSCNHCHDRLCTPCANQRSWRLSQALQGQIKGKQLTFITLTLCGKNEALGDLIDRLYRHFRSLRSHPLWESVEGGAAFLEIKWSDKAQRWHPHLHIICESRFVDQGELSSVWRGITKDSFIVDIRKVRDPEVTARYVTKYASKPLNMSFANTPKLLDEAVLALKGRRLCLCFGSWYGTPLDLADDAELADDLIDAAGWTNILPLEDAISRANGGDADCIEMIRSIGAEAKWLAQLNVI